ncbi:olfactory receptor 6J1-like [Alligator sinensis]|uniref:Olfactory receptor n=1 Tax=Alligator sinensis TaxID=38654 RepID=A0A1U7SNM7_ALLSI|nr:olfactory receptor 6J1-like [Alligator sinensis]QKE59405.1 olfactory receptor 6J1-like protein [Alligator sinensis]
MENDTSRVTEFVLLGFPIGHKEEILLSALLLTMYILTLTGNLVILGIVPTSRQLHTPMYYFLCNLSVLDIFFTSVIIPQFISNLLSGDKTISFTDCITQLYFYFFLGTVEFFLLTSMSYDRYAAICTPLHYHTLMNGWVCTQMVLGCWLGGFLSVIFPTILISRLPYCRSNVIDHFFCDSGPLLELSCSDTRMIELIDFMLSSIVILCSLVLTIISYAYIISTILRIPTSMGRRKAFNTCSSHLTIISISCGITIFIYVTPSQKGTLGLQKIPAVLTTIVCPFLNPFIFTLRNDTAKAALKQCFIWLKDVVVQGAVKCQCSGAAVSKAACGKL